MRRQPEVRAALLHDLAAIAHHLAADELRVLVAIATRAWAGQARYGCLRLAHDRRDLRHPGHRARRHGRFARG